MKSIAKKLPYVGILIISFLLLFTVTASAHVTVSPKEVLTAQRVTFAVSVPNEHDTPVVGVRIVIPEGVTSVIPYNKSGWNIEIVKASEGEEAPVTEIKWTSANGTVPVGLKDDFLFGAKAPDTVTELNWKAYETYQDGTVVAWDQEPSDADGNFPYSVTKVAVESTQSIAINETAQLARDAKAAADRTLITAISALIISVGAFYFATRKK